MVSNLRRGKRLTKMSTCERVKVSMSIPSAGGGKPRSLSDLGANERKS